MANHILCSSVYDCISDMDHEWAIKNYYYYSNLHLCAFAACDFVHYICLIIFLHNRHCKFSFSNQC